jgi:predicted acylesterase/phospholipase RssA
MPRPLTLLLALLVVARTAASQSLVPRRDTRHVSALLTISGGISLGSYEAGVNWALLEMFKLTAQDSLRRAWNLPRYELKAMGGASAGNINGFLAAIDWCRTTAPTPPEQSLFWKIWVRVGFDQLFPLTRYNQRDSTTALFSRRYFQHVLFDTVRATMRDLPPSPTLDRCAIPVGVTISKVVAGKIPISPGIDAATQRYAATVLVRRQGNTMEFRKPPAELLDDAGLGAQWLLPDCHGAVEPDDVFALIEASSAFPGAFAPISLRGQTAPGQGCGPSGETAVFSDGGLFDNNPIDLVAGIYADAIWKHPDRPDPNALLVFIAPDALRGRLAAIETQRKPEAPATGGISALLALFWGAVPAARQYELQAFGRLLGRAPQIFRRENIEVTNRRFAVVGDRLHAFAAFLGQPFREYDFYVGVYDALTFMAGEGCRAAQGVDSTCLVQRLATLVAAPQLDLGASPFPRTMLRALYAREYSGDAHAAAVPSDTSPASRPVPLRAGLLRALLNAHLALDAAPPFDNATCQGDLVTRMLCQDGFREMLGRVASDPAVRAIIDSAQRNPRPECAPERWATAPVRCDATASFLALLDNPERFMAAKLGLMLHQLWRVELIRKRAHDSAYTAPTALGEVLYQSSIGYRYRRGLDVNTSSVPRGSGVGWIASLVPNYETVSLLNAAFELGYRPMVHIDRSLAVGLTVAPLHVTGHPALSAERLHWVVGPMLHWKRSSMKLSGLETGVEVFGNWRQRPPGSPGAQVWAIPVTAYLLADKVRVGIRLLPGNRSAIYGGREIALTFGLADLNGLLYWILRKS